jgi:glycogen debranching enzyme
MGAYVDAMLYAEGERAETKTKARDLLRPLVEHLDERCIGQVSEIFDGKAPHVPHGCPAQAWSVAELLRAWRRVTGTTSASRSGSQSARAPGTSGTPERASTPAKPKPAKKAPAAKPKAAPKKPKGKKRG